MPNLRSVVVTGGGTAGHVIPAKPIIETLLHQGAEVTFIGSTSGLEEQLVKDLDVQFNSITTGKLRRYLSLQNLLDFFRVPFGILQSVMLLIRNRPQVVFSKGGYVAFPVVFAAWLLRIPVVSHESDLTAGLANRMAIPFSHTLCVNFAASQIHAKRVVVTGTPLRESLLTGNAEKGRAWLGVEADLPMLVIVGGSLGAATLNEIVRLALPELCALFSVVHICGAGKVSAEHKAQNRYFQFEFIDEAWGDVLAAADLVVSRAGANSLYELLALRKCHILVPLPETQSRGDQLENAAMSKRNGWSVVLLEEDLSPDRLTKEISTLYSERDQRRAKLQEFERLESLSLIEQVLQSSVAKE